MAVDVKWRLVADGALVDGTEAAPYSANPYTLFRGMIVSREYSYLYCVNEGASALSYPSHTSVSLNSLNDSHGFYNRKVTDNDTGTVKIAYDSSNSGKGINWWNTYQLGPTEIEATSHSMIAGQEYRMYSKYLFESTFPVREVEFKHLIGGY